jgi:hypothetical protein
MPTRPADELFYDSEAMLRLVDRALDELRLPPGVMHETHFSGREAIALSDLPHVLLRAYSEISSVLATLRRSREVLERSTVEKLQQTSRKLNEITSTTELAASDMLDRLDRALAIVDSVEARDAGKDPDGSHADLRNELYGIMTCLQFQDITAQQMNYASSVLFEAEERMVELARLFDPDVLGLDRDLGSDGRPLRLRSGGHTDGRGRPTGTGRRDSRFALSSPETLDTRRQHETAGSRYGEPAVRSSGTRGLTARHRPGFSPRCSPPRRAPCHRRESRSDADGLSRSSG